MNARDIAGYVKSGKLLAAETTKKTLENIHAKDSEIGAFLETFEESAMRKACQIDSKFKKGEKLGKLAGVPVAIKDNILYGSHRMTCASKTLKNYISPYTATAVQKLLDEDAVIVGRTNMDEFAMGSSTENSAFQITRNPYDKNRVPGGSSGGSAAAVAAGMVPLSLGSDTGGSVRQPAAFCGVYGLKPTYGSVSRYGLAAFASSMEQIGPFAGDIEDLKLIFSVISGRDEKDSTSLPAEKQVSPALRQIKIGVPTDKIFQDVSGEIMKAFEETLDKIKREKISVKEISLESIKFSVPAYYIIASSEASSNLARYDGTRYGFEAEGKKAFSSYSQSRGEGFSSEVKRRILLGTYALSAGYYEEYYLTAKKVKHLVRADFGKAFQEVDIILTPTTPTAAFKLGEKTNDPLSMYLSDVFTAGQSLAGICALNAPVKTGNLPCGVQFSASHFKENLLFDIVKKIWR